MPLGMKYQWALKNNNNNNNSNAKTYNTHMVEKIECSVVIGIVLVLVNCQLSICVLVHLCGLCCRHETYQHQYRAMFVINCFVRMNEVLRYNEKTPSDRKTRRHSSKQQHRVSDQLATAANSASDDVYHPVVCSVCNSEVAVYDNSEVYHFFNVLASYA